MIINKKYVRENYPKGYKYLFSYHILNCVGLFWPLSPEAQHLTGRKRDEATQVGC
jgi:hypothetical protein